MTKTLISDFCSTDIGLFLQDLTPVQANTVRGGSNTISVINISDGVNNTVNTYEGSDSFNYRDNKVYTVDYSRSNYNLFYISD
ncbi:hypothetical protein A6770_20745 [Nostoc minutum NIES-26]|uniref:Uncharacterized protein n=1 Tax=Nostoc minutum NIES-26 TaxID=1844469 RepID=A0A367R5Q1_9NOSO|nr:hypothetical protein A6770_20745 [Nostoc minutum NIES-26]